MDADVAEAAAMLRADLALLDRSAKEAASLLDLSSWQLGELARQASPMTAKTLPLARAKENIAAAKKRSEEVLEHLDTSRRMQSVIQAGPRAHLEAFLAALERLEVAVDFLQAHRRMASADDALQHTAALRDAGLAACAREFSALLQKHSVVPPALSAQLRAAAGEAGPGGSRGAAAAAALAPGPLNLLPEAVLAKLRALAGPMLRGGSQAAPRAYAEARRGLLHSQLDGWLAPLAGGREELARLSWQQLEGRIPGWTAALRLFVRLAQEEARLCAAVFPAAEQAGVLAQVAAAGSGPLLEGAEAVLAARRVPDKLFGVLDMHGVLEGSLPPLQAALAAGAPRLAGAPAAAAEAPQAVALLSQLGGRLGAEARACFAELQESVAREAVRSLPADGTVHPLCASAVSLLRRVLSYEAALPVLFGDGASPSPRGAGTLAAEARLLERMGQEVGRTLDSLLAALEAKARQSYKARGLAALHCMNNACFVLHACTEGRELRAVGEGWAERNKGRADDLRQQFVEQAWGPLLALLRADARQPVPAGLAGDKAARQAVKDRWTAVNRALAEAQPQQAWAVPNPALRFALRDALAEQVLPLYEAFYAKYRQAPYSSNRGKYERHSPADVAALLNELFERAEAGGPSQVGRTPSKSPNSSGNLGRRLSGMRRLTSGSQGTP